MTSTPDLDLNYTAARAASQDLYEDEYARYEIDGYDDLGSMDDSEYMNEGE